MTATAGASSLAVEPFAVLDGGLSTALELLGHRPSGLLWTAQLVVDQPQVITAAHRSFVEAGADIVISSSYQASVAGFGRAGLSPAAATRALLSTTELARLSGVRYVAASIGPFGATLGDGSEYHGSYAASWDEVRSFHRQRLEVLADSGADLFAIETIPGVIEAEIVLDELRRVSDRPAWLSVSCRSATHTCAGDEIGVVAELAGRASNLVAVGVNCTDPRFVGELLRSCRAATDLPLVAYPNHGRLWHAEQERWIGDDGDDHVGHRVAEWFATGARFIGGCCGVGPAGVREVAAARSALACGT